MNLDNYELGFVIGMCQVIINAPMTNKKEKDTAKSVLNKCNNELQKRLNDITH